MSYTVVALNNDNQVAHRIRSWDTYPSALGYMQRHLPTRPNLDMIDSDGFFVAWELTPARLAAV